MNKEYAVMMNHITKRFPGIVALDDVSFNVKPGEIHALIGENGAGKSTLMKVLGGVYVPESGDITINGQLVQIHSARDAINYGISVIYQELNLVPSLTISENIYLGQELSKNGWIDRSAMHKKAKEIVATLGFASMDCETKVQVLSIAQQQIVEIAKALHNESKILVMDEPTAVLTEKESEILFNVIRQLKERGVAIVYISHRLEEIIQLSDRITVLRDGKFVVELDNSEHDVPKENLVKYMIGRELLNYYPERRTYLRGEPILEVHHLTKNKKFYDINFTLCKGEILGIFGLVGAGRTELINAIYGSYGVDSGKIILEGNEVSFSLPADAVRNGLALVPENRKEDGLVLIMSGADNICLPNANLFSKYGHILQKKKKKLTEEYFNKLDIRPNIPEREAMYFSGGNQQKIVVSKWLASNPKIIILDEPTRGIDISAKKEIYQIIKDMILNRISVIIVSSDMSEILSICDRILVMHEGRLTAEYDYQNATQENLMSGASGIEMRGDQIYA